MYHHRNDITAEQGLHSYATAEAALAALPTAPGWYVAVSLAEDQPGQIRMVHPDLSVSVPYKALLAHGALAPIPEAIKKARKAALAAAAGAAAAPAGAAVPIGPTPVKPPEKVEPVEAEA
jgi:hypothetical protein